jgi:putative nucleotidyltransferase with HDIG domain
MIPLVLVSDAPERTYAARRELATMFDIKVLPLHRISEMDPADFTVVDLTVVVGSGLSDIQLWLKRRPKGAQVIFVVDESSAREAIQAFSIGATDLTARPLNAKTLLKKFLGDIGALAGNPSETPASIAVGVQALQDVFASAQLGGALNPKAVENAGEAVASQVQSEGLGRWIEVVRSHHSQTYQHCLIVTGVAVTFGKHLGFSAVDQGRLSAAGLLHDIGKSRIPIAILEKPGPLDADELSVMRQHPLLGVEALQVMSGIDCNMLDVVAHHHEYLDGSGYPHKLQGRDISDVVRVMTISDIFGALIERRSYKPPMSGGAAYKVLKDMGPKLDRDIVREFESISKIQFLNDDPKPMALSA